jgi:uncharacterized protein YecT (DUF1311 family)
MTVSRLVAAVGLAFVLPAALAGQPRGCNPRTFSEMHQCAVARYGKAGENHRRVYREAAARLEPFARGKLKKAEEAWLRYREAQCDYESSRSAGRREYQVVRLRCMAELTEARTALLRAQSAEK